MDELISRQAAIRFIRDKVNLSLFMKRSVDKADKACVELCEMLDRDLPTAQPEIIRCKDCKHQVKEWRDDKRFKDKGYWVYGCKVLSDICGYWAWFGQDDEFCSEAERRTDE